MSHQLTAYRIAVSIMLVLIIAFVTAFVQLREMYESNLAWTHNTIGVGYKHCSPVNIAGCVTFFVTDDGMRFRTSYVCDNTHTEDQIISQVHFKFDDESEWIVAKESHDVTITDSTIFIQAGGDFDLAHAFWQRMLSSDHIHVNMPIYDHGAGPHCGYSYTIDLYGITDAVYSYNKRNPNKLITTEYDSSEHSHDKR